MNLDKISSLKRGCHSPGADMCAMEAVAFLAGEPWSHWPQCACPVIACFVNHWNDYLPSDAERDRLLKPLLPLIIGTRSSPWVQHCRYILCVDWLIRVCTPAFLRLAGLQAQATTLSGMTDIDDSQQFPELFQAMQSVRLDLNPARGAAEGFALDAARSAAGRAQMESAMAAAWFAVRDAVLDDDELDIFLGHELYAALQAARLVWRDTAEHVAQAAAVHVAPDAAEHFAQAAAWLDARSAKSAAAWDALKPTADALQTSAVDLLKLMCAEGREA